MTGFRRQRDNFICLSICTKENIFAKSNLCTHLVGDGGNADEKTNRKGELPVIEAELANQTSVLLLLLC